MDEAAGDAISRLVSRAFLSREINCTVEYIVLHHADFPTTAPTPLILHLHGAMSSAHSLETYRAVYDEAWAEGILPPALVACATTPTIGGFHMDYRDGAKWEAMLSDALPEMLSDIYGPLQLAGIIGSSMEGYGALKLAFRRPDRLPAVAALCPAKFPAEMSGSVPAHTMPSILRQLNDAMGSDPKVYRMNSVYGLARANAAVLRRGQTRIYFDCGDLDEFHLHEGASYLDDVLGGLGIPHQFHSVSGAGHADAAMVARMRMAVGFLGKAMSMFDLTRVGRSASQ